MNFFQFIKKRNLVPDVKKVAQLILILLIKLVWLVQAGKSFKKLPEQPLKHATKNGRKTEETLIKLKQLIICGNRYVFVFTFLH